MTYNKFLATEISGLRDPTYASGAASKHYVDTISSNIAAGTYNSESDLTAILNDNYAGSGNINRTLLNSISSNIDNRVDSLFNWSSNALTKYGASSHSHDNLYYTETESRTNFYPSSLGKSLMNFSANKSLYPASSLVNRNLINSISSNIDTRVDSIFGFSSNVRNIYYYSSLGHFFTGSGVKLNTAYIHSQDNTQAHSDYLLNDADDTTTGTLNAKSFSGPLSGARVSGGIVKLTTISGITRNITYSNLVDLTDGGDTTLHTHVGMTTDVAWSGAYQFTAVSGMVKVLDTWYDVSSSKLSHAYASTSTGKFELALTKGTLTATSPIVLSDSTRQVIGGATVISISNYIGSTQAIARFSDSSNIRFRFVASSVAISNFYDSESDLTALLNDNYAGSSNVNRALVNSISSNLDTRIDGLFNFSSNKSLYPASSLVNRALINSISSNLDTRVDSLFNYSSNKSLYPVSSLVNRSLINSISSNLDIRIDSLFNFSSNKSLYANSANVRFRFQASSLARQSYLHSANQSIHSFNAVNYITSANAISRFADSSNVKTRFVQSGGTKWTAIAGIGGAQDISNLYHTHSQYGGGTTPGGGTNYIQYNNGGNFTGDSSFTWNETTNTLRISGSISGAYISAGTIKGNNLAIGDISNTEFGYLNGVTSAIQTQLDSKASIASYIASTTAIAKFAGSSNINRVLLNSISSNLDTRIDSIFGFSSNARNIYYYSSLGHFFTGSGTKLHNAYLSANKVMDSFNHTLYLQSSANWTDLTDTNDTTLHKHDTMYYTETESRTNFAGSANVNWTKITAISSGFDGRLDNLEDNDVFVHTSYITSTNSISRFYPSTLAKEKFVSLFNTSSSHDTRIDSLFGWSSNAQELYADSSNVRLRFQASSLARQSYLHSSNAGIHSFNVINYITSTNSINRFYPSTLARDKFLSLFNWSTNAQEIYPNSGNIRFRFQASSLARQSYLHSSNQGIHSFNVANYITSTNAITRFFPSTAGHPFFNSGTKFNSTYNWFVESGVKLSTHENDTTFHLTTVEKTNLTGWYSNSSNKLSDAYASTSTGVFAIASHTHAASDVAWSGAYQFTAVSSMVKTLDTWYDVSSEKLSNAYVSTSTGIFAIAAHTHAASDVAWSGAYQFYAVSSLNKTQNSQYTSFSSNLHYFYNSGIKFNSTYSWYNTSAQKLSRAYVSTNTGIFAIAAHTHSTYVDTANSPNANEFARFTDANTIEGRTYAEARADLSVQDIVTSGVKYTWAYASMLASGNEIYAAYKHSSNLAVHNPSGVKYTAAYVHSANKSLHDCFTFTMGMVRLSANQAIKVGGFQMASSQNLYVWKANCCDSGGRSQGDLWIQVASGSRGNLNNGPYTNIYKTSCNRIQKGKQVGTTMYPLATYGTARNGSNIVVRMMWSGTGVTPGGWVHGCGGKFGTSFVSMSTY